MSRFLAKTGEGSFDGALPEPYDSKPSPEASAQGRQKLQNALGVIQKLPEQQREALLLAVDGDVSPRKFIITAAIAVCLWVAFFVKLVLGRRDFLVRGAMIHVNALRKNARFHKIEVAWWCRLHSRLRMVKVGYENDKKEKHASLTSENNSGSVPLTLTGSRHAPRVTVNA